MTVRITHVLPHRGGGGELYIDMLERLAGYEHQRFYISRDRTPSSGMLSIPARWPRLAVAARGTDLIHCHGDVTSAIASPLLRTRPAVLTTHGLSMLRRVRGTRRRVMIQVFTAAVRRSRAVICTSAAERDELAALLPKTEREKLHVIHNGIDPPAPIDEPRRAQIRRELGADPETVLGLFAGQLDPNKAPLLAARAATQLYAAGVPFLLAVAGDGPQAPELRAVAGEAVRVLGYRSDMERLLDAADLFVQPSEREGMSYALLEAMGHGLAVVAADGPGNPEAVGDAALLFAAGEVGALVSALRTLAIDPQLRADLGGRARRRTLEQFTVVGFLAATDAVYSQSLRSVRASQCSSRSRRTVCAANRIVNLPGSGLLGVSDSKQIVRTRRR
jgi:glycosyltransferase involved in cell wall biosynthesis